MRNPAKKMGVEPYKRKKKKKQNKRVLQRDDDIPKNSLTIAAEPRRVIMSLDAVLEAIFTEIESAKGHPKFLYPNLFGKKEKENEKDQDLQIIWANRKPREVG